MKLVIDLEEFKKNVFLDNKEDIKQYINDIYDEMENLLDYLRDNEEDDYLTIEMKNRLFDVIMLLQHFEIKEVK